MPATNNADLVRLTLDGLLFLRPYNSAAITGPGDISSLSDDHYLGYYSEDGYTLAPEPGDTNEFRAHNSDIVDDTVDEGFWTFQVAGLETRENIVNAYFETTVDSDGHYAVTTSATNKRYNLVSVGKSKNGGVIVTEFPFVKINEREGITFNRSTLVAYGMTFRAYKHPTRVDVTTGKQVFFEAWDSLLGADDSSSSSSS